MSVSILRWTGQAIALPFMRFDRMAIAGLPFAVLAAVAWRTHNFYSFISPPSLVSLSVPALQELGRQFNSLSFTANTYVRATDSTVTTYPLLFWCIGWLALAFWLCAWQRAVATGFQERLAPWLTASLRRMPAFLVLFGAWSLICFALFGLANDLYSNNLWLADFPAIQPNGLPPARAPAATILGLLAALWLFVRFAPLTAMLAADDSRSLGEVFRASAGLRGVLLGLAVIGLLLLSWALSVASRNAVVALPGMGNDGAWTVYVVYTTRSVAVLTQLWLGTLAALVASGMNRTSPIRAAATSIAA